MSSSQITLLVGLLVWSLACGVLAYQQLRRPKGTPLHHDQFLSLVACLSLAVAPWMSWLVHLAGDGTSMLGGLPNLLVGGVVGLVAGLQRKRRLSGKEPRLSTLSFREKSARLVLVTLVVVYGAYALVSWNYPTLIVPLFLGSALLTTIVAIAGHIVVALNHTPAPELHAPVDERDTAAIQAGRRLGYPVLSLGIWVVAALALLGQPMLWVANAAFLFIVAGQIAEYAGMLRYYRRGAP